MLNPAFVTAVVTTAAVLLVAQSAPHRRVKVAVTLWVASVVIGVFLFGASGWSSIVSFVLFFAMLFAKGIPMALRTGGGDQGHPMPKA